MTRNVMRFTVCLLAACAGLAAHAGAAQLNAGVAVVDISPDTRNHLVPLGGYGARQNAPALGVHDSTLAKALILKQRKKKFALVTLDLQGVPRSLRDEVLVRVGAAGITSDNLLLAASHSHGSVEMNAMNRSNVFQNKAIGIYDEYLLTFTADRIAEAILRANESFQPVRVGSASVDVPGMNANRRGGALTDTTMTITRFDRLDGSPKVVLINYTAHPTYLSEETMYLSAGWPGYLQREVEGFLGGGAICMYANGAEGDVAPAGGEGPSEFARAEDHGRKLAVKALRLIDTIETDPDVKLKYSMTLLKLPPREAPKALLDAAGPEYGITEANVQLLIDALVPETSYLTAFQLGGLTAVSIPGEMTSVLGLEIKAALSKAGAEYPVVVGLGNEWISYMLATDEYHGGGYEPGVSFYGETLGPVVAEQAVAAGEELLAAR